MKINTLLTVLYSVSLSAVLTACGTAEDHSEHSDSAEVEKSEHTHMVHSGSGEVPEELKVAESPAFEVGSRAIITADHMAGMDGTEATIAGAFDTTVYEVTYTPAAGGSAVPNHKWVIHEELENPGDAPLAPGTKVVLNADHMENMEGAEGVIESAEETTVYMVDFVPAAGGEEVTNHKWVTESELSAE